MSIIDITPAIEDIEAEDTITTEAALAEGADPAEDEPIEDIEPEEDLVAVRLDPRTVRIEANVRSTVVVSTDMLRSVKRHGVVIPVLGYYDADGQPVIRDGQRRILSTIKAGRASLPAYLVPSKGEKRLRIIQQMIANMYREGLTDADEAAALHELTLDGMTPTMIASELTYKPARVKAALAVAENETATKAVTQHQLTLDQAATLASAKGGAQERGDRARLRQGWVWSDIGISKDDVAARALHDSLGFINSEGKSGPIQYVHELDLWWPIGGRMRFRGCREG